MDEELQRWIEWRLVRVSKEEMLRERIPLFPNPTARNRERRWIANTLREEWNRAAEKVGVRVRMYEGTKHSSATAWLAQGSSLQMIQRMLRHADSRSTERYAKLGDLALVSVIRPRDEARRESGCGSDVDPARIRPRKPLGLQRILAGRTGLEPATSDVTGRCSNRLNYRPARREVYRKPRRGAKLDGLPLGAGAPSRTARGRLACPPPRRRNLRPGSRIG